MSQAVLQMFHERNLAGACSRLEVYDSSKLSAQRSCRAARRAERPALRSARYILGVPEQIGRVDVAVAEKICSRSPSRDQPVEALWGGWAEISMPRNRL